MSDDTYIDWYMEKQKLQQKIDQLNQRVKELEAAQRCIQNGIKYGYINMPDNNCGDSALETPAKIEKAIQKAKREKQ